MLEVWKNIIGYEDLYQVSNTGKVRNKRSGKELKQCGDGRGYLKVNLCKNGKPKNYKVHRLVAQTFISNPNSYIEINHKDENKNNNTVENLEWCDRKYNNVYGSRITKTTRAVAQYDLNCNLVRKWDSIMDCERSGFNRGCIWNCCNGKSKTHKKYIWKYA